MPEIIDDLEEPEKGDRAGVFNTLYLTPYCLSGALYGRMATYYPKSLLDALTEPLIARSWQDYERKYAESKTKEDAA